VRGAEVRVAAGSAAGSVAAGSAAVGLAVVETAEAARNQRRFQMRR
jgi:hypothetical protein